MFQIITIESGRAQFWRAMDSLGDAARELDWLAMLGQRAIMVRNK